MRLLLALLCTSLLASVEWPATVTRGATTLQLRGSERFTWLWYKIYDVALHVPAATPTSAILAATPRQLTFRYLRAFTAAELGKATSETASERIGSAPRAEIDAGIAAINALWPSVAVGDELTLAYAPGTGVAVAHNGRTLGTVPGDAFASVLFSIWLGATPIDDDLRDGLLASH